MNTNKPDDCCSDQHCDSGRRNRFFANKRTTPDTWRVEQDYQQQRRRLINRAVHGWGVVYGFDLGLADDDACTGDGGQGLAIGAGLAFDNCGRELVQVKEKQFAFDDLLVFDANGGYLPRPERGSRQKGWPFPDPAQTKGKCLLLKAHYAERLISPVPVKDPCACDDTEWDQVCETIVYSLTLFDCDCCCKPQGCKPDEKQPCKRPCCELECDCRKEGEKPSRCCPGDDHKPAERGGCRCLCEHLTRLDVTPECCTLTKVGDTLKVDLRHGVALACLTIRLNRCNEWTFDEVVDACGPRRFVKRNDLLFDLIRGCDLTRICWISWADWHRELDKPVKFDDFVAKFGTANKDDKNEYVTDFFIEFSKPVDTRTLRADAFTMSIIARDDGDGWGRTLRIPIADIQVDDPSKPYSRTARIIVASYWATGALNSTNVFGLGATRCEISVRGDYLLDCNGQTVDANARGLDPAPTGNGTPGDTFFSTFLIEKLESKGNENQPL